MTIDIANETDVDVELDEIHDCARYAMDAMFVHPNVELSIRIIDEAAMETLHVQWMDLPGPTDVMSFPMDELTPGGGRPDASPFGAAMLGDIILCPSFDRKQAEMAGHDLGHELALLTVHGVLHLLGYDHVMPDEEREMFSLQNELLADWYDSLAARGIEYQPKPTGAHAFPSAADREELDRMMKGRD